ncbi:MAG TPA: hydroxymethylbilane synthase [Streptosporangiales bacterium]
MTTTRTLRIGTRASALARVQTTLVADAIREDSGCAVELVDVTTRGDVDRASLAQIGGTGVFVAALRERLLDGSVDVAVHSLKDLPTTMPDRLRLAAVPVREDPRDALVAPEYQTLAGLPPGARVGTGSPRRAAQVRAARPDVTVVDIRGNVDTRLKRVTGAAEDRLDAVVLAYAGLVRLGRADEVTEVLPPELMLPAPGQGALAVECRADDEATAVLLKALDDESTRVSVAAERALLATLEAGCAAPVGALATVAGGGGVRTGGAAAHNVDLRAVVFAPDGTASVRRTATGPLGEPERLGRELAAELLAGGAAALMGEQET